MTGLRGWMNLDAGAVLTVRRDAKALVVWQTGACATALLAGSVFDATGILQAVAILLIVLGIIGRLVVQPEVPKGSS